VMLRDGLTDVPDEMKKLRAKFRDPATPSRSSAADAVQKQVTALPWMADSDVTLEQLGYDETDIARLTVDRDRAQAGNRLAELVTVARNVRASGDLSAAS
jgi:hypothetical protein